jgi:hypothetical protein
VIWGVRAPSASASSALARRVFDEAARLGLHLALAELPVRFFDLGATGMDQDKETLTCLRSVLMKPEHRAWVGAIWERVSAATERAVGGRDRAGHGA